MNGRYMSGGNSKLFDYESFLEVTENYLIMKDHRGNSTLYTMLKVTAEYFILNNVTNKKLTR